MNEPTTTTPAPITPATRRTEAREATPAKPPRFRIDHPRAGWEGTLKGVKFEDGVGHTDSSAVAFALMEDACRPFDNDAGKFAWDSDTDEAKTRLAEKADQLYPQEGK